MRLVRSLKLSFSQASLSMLAVLLVIELAMHLPGVWELDRFSHASLFDRVVAAASQRSASPKIAAFGSSRFQYAISPEDLENGLNLQPGEVSNLAFRAATAQDYLNLYSSHRKYLADVDVLLLEVGELSYTWTTIVDRGAGDIRFRRLSGFEDRLAVPGVNNKIDYLLGYVFKLWDTRSAVRTALESGMRGKIDNSLSVNGAGQIDIRDRKRNTDPEAAIRQAHNFFSDFRFSEYQLNALAELVRVAQADGVRIVLVNPPLSPDFDNVVSVHYGVEDRLWKERIEEASGLRIIDIGHSDPACSDWRQCYFDYGHMNPAGSNSFSTSVADYLADNSLFERRTATTAFPVKEN